MISTKIFVMAVCGSVLAVGACKQKMPAEVQPPSRETVAANKLMRLKNEARPGDLVVRLGDDLLSYQIKFLNEKDQSWSHAGIVMEKDGKKIVVHISPDEAAKDGVQYTPVDSFLNPAKNLSCALYRYNFTPAERELFLTTLEEYKAAGLNFDRLYDLEGDEKMYCSEMISKAIGKATAGRIKFREVRIPERMHTALYHHFKKELSRQTIAQRKIMTIDNLYHIPECEQVMQFTLKYLPGQ